MKTAIVVSLVLMCLAPICKAELRFIVVEVNMMTNAAVNGVITIDSRTNQPVSVSIRSAMKSEQRENVSINDAAKVLKDGIQFTGSSVWVVMVLNEGVYFPTVRSLVKTICENTLLQLIDLRSLQSLNVADNILKRYGIKNRTRGQGVPPEALPTGDQGNVSH